MSYLENPYEDNYFNEMAGLEVSLIEEWRANGYSNEEIEVFLRQI